MQDRRQQILTFVFTDIQGSTQLARSLNEDYPSLLSIYRKVIRLSIAKHFGLEVDCAGDGFFIAFRDPVQAVLSAGAMQIELHKITWPIDTEVKVRIGVHTGVGVASESGYTGLAVHMTSRICDAAHGDQVLLSSATAKEVQGTLIEGYQLKNLGKFHLKGFETPEEIHQLIVPNLSAEFPIPRALPALPVVAVLPFYDLGNNPDNEYFCDGISTDIIHALARLPGLRVVARSASCVFKSDSEDILEIGKKLNANGVLHGEMRKYDNKIELSVELTDVSKDQMLWSSQFKGNLKDMFVIEDEVAEHIAKSFGVTFKSLSPLRKMEQVRSQSVEAYDFYLKGRKFYYQFSKQGVLFALQMFQQAIHIDPDFALAYTGAADCYSYLYMYDEPSESNLTAAEQMSLKAIELSPSLAEAHASRGVVLSLSKDFDSAEECFEKAIALDPQLFEAYYLYGRVAFAAGKIEKTAGLFRDANRVRPDDYQSLLLAAQCFDSMGLEKRATEVRKEGIAIVEKQLKLNPGDTRALYMGANSQLALGNKDIAFSWLQRALTLEPGDPMLLYNAGCIYARAGMQDEALESLERSVEAGLTQKEWYENDPDLNGIRDCKQFIDLLKKLDHITIPKPV